MLLRQRRAADLPHDLARGALDHHDCRDVAEADQDVALGGLGDGVAVGPFVTHVLRRDRIGLRFHVFPAAPFPDDFARNGHFEQVVGVDDPVGFGAGQPTLHATRDRLR